MKLNWIIFLEIFWDCRSFSHFPFFFPYVKGNKVGRCIWITWTHLQENWCCLGILGYGAFRITSGEKTHIASEFNAKLHSEGVCFNWTLFKYLYCTLCMRVRMVNVPTVSSERSGDLFSIFQFTRFSEICGNMLQTYFQRNNIYLMINAEYSIWFLKQTYFYHYTISIK